MVDTKAIPSFSIYQCLNPLDTSSFESVCFQNTYYCQHSCVSFCVIKGFWEFRKLVGHLHKMSLHFLGLLNNFIEVMIYYWLSSTVQLSACELVCIYIIQVEDYVLVLQMEIIKLLIFGEEYQKKLIISFQHH